MVFVVTVFVNEWGINEISRGEVVFKRGVAFFGLSIKFTLFNMPSL